MCTQVSHCQVFPLLSIAHSQDSEAESSEDEETEGGSDGNNSSTAKGRYGG